MKRNLPIILVGPLLWALSACSFVDEIEIEYGSGANKLNPIRIEVSLPDVGTIAGMAAGEALEGIPGVPGSLEAFTLAHLRGALILSGSCAWTGVADRRLVEGRIDADRTTMTLVDCGGDARCGPMCPEGMVGLLLVLDVRAEVLGEKKAKSIAKKLSKASPEAIRQFRLRFDELVSFQGRTEPDGTFIQEPTTDRIADFTLDVVDDHGNLHPVLDLQGMLQISPETPRRFEFPMTSPLMQEMTQDMLAGRPVWLNLLVQILVDLSDLYSLELGNAGIRVDIQPELSVRATEAAGE